MTAMKATLCVLAVLVMVGMCVSLSTDRTEDSQTGALKVASASSRQFLVKRQRKRTRQKGLKPKKKSARKKNPKKSTKSKKKGAKQGKVEKEARKAMDKGKGGKGDKGGGKGKAGDKKKRKKRKRCRHDKECSSAQRCVGYDAHRQPRNGKKHPPPGFCMKKRKGNQPCGAKKDPKCPSGYFCSTSSHSVGTRELRGTCSKKLKINLNVVSKKLMEAKDRFAKLLKGYKPVVVQDGQKAKAAAKGKKGKTSTKPRKQSKGSGKKKRSKKKKRGSLVSLREKITRAKDDIPWLPLISFKLPVILPKELEKQTAGKVPWCSDGRSHCDAPQTRDKYLSPNVTVAFDMTFHVFKKTAKGKFRTTTKKLKTSLREVNQVYKDAKIKFAFRLKEYVSPDMYHTVVGPSADCAAADQSLEVLASTNVPKGGSLAFVGKQKLRTDDKTTNTKERPYYFLKGDKVKFDLYIGGSPGQTIVELCAVNCGEDKKCASANRKKIKCFNRTQAQGSWDGTTVTLTDRGYHAVVAYNHNKTAPVNVFSLMQWQRKSSCTDAENLLSSMDKDYKTKWTPFNVVVTDFVAKPDNNGLFMKDLFGVGYYPWNDKRGIALMAYDHFGKNAKRLLAHELGHTLGLLHTFHGVNDITNPPACRKCTEKPADSAAKRDIRGDFCSDTPPELMNWKCSNAVGEHTCGKGTKWATKVTFTKKTGAQPFKNIMSYSPCRKEITPQQIARIRCYIAHTERIKKAIKTVVYK